MTLTASPPRRASASSREKPPRPDLPLSVALDWVEAHCVIPDGFRKGQPFKLYGWQVAFLGNFYLVRRTAEWDARNPVLGPAFVYRRGLMVGPQKLGKDPLEAAHICLEGVGPVLFAGWAGADDGYACADHGCRCGWDYPYPPGDPMGMPWPTPEVQITAVSEDATANTYRALRPMIEEGPLADLIPKTGEEFIRLPNGGRIDTVTASAQSRLGQRVTFVSQGEVGLYTKQNGMQAVADTQYRGLAGMGGRAALHTNAWDPSENSVAQQQYESSAVDVYRQFVRPPSGLSFRNREDRWRIFRIVYPADTLRERDGHVDLDAIEAEAADLAARDTAQAARFFGNQLVAGAGRAFDPETWEARAKPGHQVPDKARITLGFDGSKTGDHTALIATEVETGHQWAAGIWNPEEHGGEVPREVVDAVVDAMFARFDVVRMYVDPPYWRDELAAWSGRYGDRVVLKWETWRNRQMGFAVRAFATAVAAAGMTHDGSEAFTRHVLNAQRKPLNERDDKGANLWAIQKETPDSPKKIDAAVAAVLSWEARNDSIAAGAMNKPRRFRAFSA